jgi:hypothetical protein
MVVASALMMHVLYVGSHLVPNFRLRGICFGRCLLASINDLCTSLSVLCNSDTKESMKFV